MGTWTLRGSATAALLLLLALWATPIPHAAALSGSNQSVAAFVALAKHGLAGTYNETYRVTGPSNGTVEVFQRAPRGVFPFPTDGTWSFVLQAQTGISSQWIEDGSKAWDCWHAATATTWTCSGPGIFHLVNSFLLSVEPYIPRRFHG